MDSQPVGDSAATGCSQIGQKVLQIESAHLQIRLRVYVSAIERGLKITKVMDNEDYVSDVSESIVSEIIKRV